MKTALQTPAKTQAQPTAAPWVAPLVQQRCVCGMVAGHDGQCSGCRRQALVGDRPVLVQRKLKLGRSDDKYEQEADRVADEIAQASRAGIQCVNLKTQKKSFLPTSAHVIPAIRKNDLTAFTDPGELKSIHTGPGYLGASGENSDFFHSLNSLNGTGRTLPQTTRSLFENFFNTNLGDVKVYTGNRADALTRSVNAEAFTSGKNIVFGRGKYRPTTQTGQKLIAHELAHVVQQRDVGDSSFSGPTVANGKNAVHPIQRRSRSEKNMAFENQLERDFHGIVTILDERHYSDSDEQLVIRKLRFWAQKGMAANGRPYLDSLLTKLTMKRKTVGLVFHQESNYYSVIFNRFDRVEEVRQIVDTYASDTFRGDTGVEEASLRKEFGRSRENFGWFWNKQFEEIGRYLKQEGVPSIIQNLLGGAVGVLEGFADLIAETIEGVWSAIEALQYLRDSILYLLMSGLQGTALKFLQHLPVVGYLFNPSTYKSKFEKTLSFIIAAKDAIQNPTVIFNSIKESAEQAWNELLDEYNSADDFNKSRIIAKGMVKIGMAVGGILKNLPNLAKKAVQAGRAIPQALSAAKSAATQGIKYSKKLITQFVKRIKQLAAKVFAGMRFRRFEIESKGNLLQLFGIRSKILLAVFRKDSIETFLVDDEKSIKPLIQARASILGKGSAAARRGDTSTASRLRSGPGARASEKIGEAGADSVITSKFPSAKNIHIGTGPRTLDLIYKTSDGKIIICEAKGGAGKISAGRTLYETSKRAKAGKQYLEASQGAFEYLEAKLVEMITRGGEEAMAAGKAMEALRKGRLRYFLSETPKIPTSPNKPLEVIIREFDMPKPSN